MFSLRNTAIAITASLFFATPTLADTPHAASCPNASIYSAVEEWGLDTPRERLAWHDNLSTQASIGSTNLSDNFELFLTYVEYRDYLEQLDQMGLLEFFTSWAEQGYSESEETWREANDIQCFYSEALDNFDVYLAYIDYLAYLDQLDRMGLLGFFVLLSEPGFGDLDEQIDLSDFGEFVVSAVA